jgi:hypothetical protein
MALERQQATSKNTNILELELEKTISKSPTSFDQIKHKNLDQTISKTTNFTSIKIYHRDTHKVVDQDATTTGGIVGLHASLVPRERRLSVRATGGEHQDAGARENVPDYEEERRRTRLVPFRTRVAGPSYLPTCLPVILSGR